MSLLGSGVFLEKNWIGVGVVVSYCKRKFLMLLLEVLLSKIVVMVVVVVILHRLIVLWLSNPQFAHPWFLLLMDKS